MSSYDADVVIVGSGCAGGILARELTDENIHVIALERGPDIDSKQYAMDELKFSIRSQVLWGPQSEPRYTWRSHEKNKTEKVITGWSGWGPGGDHLHWGAQSWRFQPATFRAKSVFGQVENGAMMDWPISYDDLEPFYQKFEERIGVNGDHTLDPYHPPRKKGYPMPPTVPNYATRHFIEAARSLNYQPFPTPGAINSVDYDGRLACGYCGFCQSYGCVVEAKGDVGLTEIRKARKNPHFDLRFHSRAFELTVDDHGRAKGVHYFDRHGMVQHVSGRIVIVAANSLESTHLMLLSKSATFPNGIANNNEQVGSYFHLRPISQVLGKFKERMNAFIGPTPRWAVNQYADDNFNPKEYGESFIMGGLITGSDPIGYAGQPISFSEEPPPEGISDWGQKYRDFIAEAYPNHYTTRIFPTEPPQLDKFVDIDPTVKDSQGISVPRVTFDWHPQTKHQLAFLRRKGEEMLEAGGATKIWGGQLGDPWELNTHEGGTVRMGEDPKQSAVNRFCQTHEVSNLFVVGSSAFPVMGGYNPGETVGALAYWVADYIKKEARDGDLFA
ncbi:GMC family oxidoreductase [Salicibibacter halophilus]|uniref:GMC family oxidoreductase n=1 Tax=Salicibibacter halophilus TaxID=2502791 RepID=A0A514LFQ8_9BACI|nr:GMC family oxidoreductase [Salicibibacter halophilus]QDI90071.1 GMC family oxidoreductase [Salicibibacter halophilus]